MKNRRVILDTNLWISFLISKRQKELDILLESGVVTLIFSQELLEEFLEVSERPKFKRFFKKSDIKALLNQIETFGELIRVESKINECRDPKDNFLLSLSVDGKADFLVTGDSDLLVLGKIEKTKIVTWAEFISQE
ncbi:putative toxin-antitoxin system toxin component, PIN family [Belliella baltica DSM 15883]|uniref:Putative toxin-antitoxin system toxin component, PIN family n=1 Tax=Belliella baltica (strain DSM 15883 / CIP 108006 / LMG 21964 / BA134) TaxID=866536 RepID=I3Z5W6_BELBD|nr:putative toxin-antitoxin system toxin component, PIN family [Belliella baltica]AFL84634.1 putative toxin-antitoxin system toxin component, PIN family [Belliella baltica DSM 15883]